LFEGVGIRVSIIKMMAIITETLIELGRMLIEILTTR
jgi:hypothetical protein